MRNRAAIRRVLAVGVVLLVAAALRAQSGRGRHKRLFAVPRPGPVTLDGRLDDWDLSGRILVYVIRETSEMQSARFALMYDADALYLAAAVRDPSPMMNRHDPRVDGHKAWDADACQFRMVLDPAQGYPVRQSSFNPVDNDQMAHLTLWYYTDRKEPNLQMHFGMGYKLPKAGYAPHGVVPRDKFQAAYRPADDRRGYTFEYRIPWKTLEARKPPKGGDLVAGTVQFNWGRADGLQSAGGSAWAYDVMSGPGFPFQGSDCWGKILFAKTGRLPRELIEQGLPPERPLPLTFAYDLPAAGEVSIGLFDERGVCARTLLAESARRAGRNVERWDGLDELGRPLPAGTYRWRGLVHQPLETRFVLSVHNSGQPPYKTDDNTGGWGGDHGCPTDVCTTGDAVVLAWNACESGWGIIRTTLAGRKQWGSKHSATFLATDGKRIFAAGDHGFEKGPGVKVFDLADSRPLNFGGRLPVLHAPPGGDEKRDAVTGLTCRAGTLYVAYAARDLVGAFDAAKGTLQATWAVPSPGRMAPRPDGSLAVLSAGKVVAVRDGKPRDLVTDHLDEPAGIATDAAGRLYVANRGRLQNVSVFSPDGRFLHSVGQRGGRPRVGRYETAGMLEPGGVAIDRKGRLWVAETLDGPKRVSVWEAEAGKLVAEYFGGSAYSAFAWMDPARADEVYCHNVLWKVDLDTGTRRPHSTVWRPSDPNAPHAPGGGFFEALRVVTAKNGRQYGWAFRHAIGPTLFLRDGDAFKPLVHFIRCIDWHSLTPWPPYPLMADKKRFPMGEYVWVDGNDDQVIQAGELTHLGRDGEKLAFHWVDERLNLWSGGGFVHRPRRITRDGRCVYDFTRPERTGVRGSNGHGPIVVDPHDGTLYTNSPASDPGFARWTPDGKLLWGYRGTVEWRDAINLPPLKPGKLWGPTCPLGVAGEFTGVATYFGPFHLFTRDGLYVGMILRDGRHGGLGADVIACESFSGQLVRPRGTDRYFLLTGDQDGRVTEILGLDTVRRLAGGRCTLTKADAAKAAKALADYEARKARSQRLTIVRGPAALATAPSVGKTVDDRRGFRARAAYDAKSLYVRFDVTSPHPLLNGIPDERILFRGGNVLDVQLAADPQAEPKRKKPAPGDVRILVTRRAGKPLAVVYRPKVKGFAGKPIVLSSPTGREPFDAIEPTDRVRLAYRQHAGRFEATVTIPLELLGLRPRPGSTVRMDVGYVFGNKTGTQAAVRAYWANNSFTANVVNDIPHESRLEPGEWGTATVE
jgi:hypothetical protein